MRKSIRFVPIQLRNSRYPRSYLPSRLRLLRSRNYTSRLVFRLRALASSKLLQEKQAKEKGKGRKTERLHRRWALVQTILTWVGRNYFPSSPRIGLNSVFGPFLSRLRWQIVAQGAPGSILWIKSERLVFLKWLSVMESGDESEASKLRGRVRKTWGAPFVEEVQKFRGANPDIVRMALTALTSLRCLRLPPEVNVEPIQAGGPSIQLPPREMVIEFWKELGVPRRPKLNRSRCAWDKFRVSMKAGPNGPALWTSLQDLVSLPGHLIKDLEVVGGPKMTSVLAKAFSVVDHFIDRKMSGRGGDPAVVTGLEVQPSVTDTEPSLPNRFPGKPGDVRRLVAIADVEGKPRTVAIGDYWSQSALWGLHQQLNRFLRKLPADMTFSQDRVVDKIREWPTWAKRYSVDLTNATDRFPRELVFAVFEPIFGKRFVESWERILVGEPFLVKQDKVHYGRGLPMGMYSCWPAFALAHHFVVFWCCKETGVDFSKARYLLLGDDVALSGNILGKAYMRKLTELHVEFSVMKTFVSDYLVEFAKRWLYKDVEITPFPCSAIVDSVRSVPLLISAMLGEEKKDLKALRGIPGAIRDLDRLRLRAAGRATSLPKRVRIAEEAMIITRALHQGVGEEELASLTRALLYPYTEVRTLVDTVPGVSRQLWTRACSAMIKRTLQEGLLGDQMLDLYMEALWLEKSLEPLPRPDWRTLKREDPHLPDPYPGELSIMESLPPLGASAFMGYLAHKLVATLPQGEGVAIEDWPDYVRAIGYRFPERLEERASDKEMRVVFSSKVAAEVVREAKKYHTGGISIPEWDTSSLQTMPPTDPTWTLFLGSPLWEPEEGWPVEDKVRKKTKGPPSRKGAGRKSRRGKNKGTGPRIKG